MWEIINDLIYALIILISVILFGILILNDYNSLKSKKSIIVFSIVCILQAITFAYFNGTIKTLIMCLTNVILFRYIFNISYSKSITIVALYTLLLMIMEFVLYVQASKSFLQKSYMQIFLLLKKEKMMNCYPYQVGIVYLLTVKRA